MKKSISSTKWLVTYLIILLFLFAFDAAGVALIVYGALTNYREAWVIGIVTLVYMLPITGIILFYLNRRACLIWTEDECLKWRGLLFGFKNSAKRKEIADVGVGKNIYLFVNSAKCHTNDVNNVLVVSNNAPNREVLKEFLGTEIDLYLQEQWRKQMHPIDFMKRLDLKSLIKNVLK